MLLQRQACSENGLGINLKLQQLAIFFELPSVDSPTLGCMNNDPSRVANVLEPFILLPNVRTVNFHQVSSVYVHYLKSLIMKASKPLEGLSAMYDESQQKLSLGWICRGRDAGGVRDGAK